MLLDDLGTFFTVLINVHMRFDSVHVQKEPVTFSSLNPLGDCPGSLNGGMRDPMKCLVVVQEWWGMNEQIKQQALDIGTQGKFVTMVPDLYRGKVAKNSTAALHLVRNLDYPGEFTITEKSNQIQCLSRDYFIPSVTHNLARSNIAFTQSTSRRNRA